MTINERPIVYFFTGYKTPPKRYLSYFPKLTLIFDPIEDPRLSSDVPIQLLTHSAGIVNACIWCSQHAIIPTCWVAMDPPSLELKNILERMNNLPNDLVERYILYLDLKADFLAQLWPTLSVVRPESTPFHIAATARKSFIYTADTHHPYHIRVIRDRIQQWLLYGTPDRKQFPYGRIKIEN